MSTICAVYMMNGLVWDQGNANRTQHCTNWPPQAWYTRRGLCATQKTNNFATGIHQTMRQLGKECKQQINSDRRGANWEIIYCMSRNGCKHVRANCFLLQICGNCKISVEIASIIAFCHEGANGTNNMHLHGHDALHLLANVNKTHFTTSQPQ